MAYLKEWSPRSYQPLELRVPELLRRRRGRRARATPSTLVDRLPEVDLAYLDPPYNQHRYVGNYHVWETLVAWDCPDHYGVACKRVDVRDPVTSSVFNRRREAPDALARLVPAVRAEVVRHLGQRRGLGDRRRPGGHGRRAGRGRGAGVRLEALRRRPDRHPQPDRGKGGTGGSNPQHGVSASSPVRPGPVARLCAGYPTRRARKATR